jgi:metal iron transporter
MNNRHLPRWLDLIIYVVAEACIICTDIGQVIGTAIALNILIPQVPLWAGCIISVAETLLVLFFYSPAGNLRNIRFFELFMAMLVTAVFITICIALSMVSEPAGEIFRGYLPSRDIFVGNGLYESCAILGGTLMPHALYVGTSLSRPRLYDYDLKHSLTPETTPNQSSETLYRPSLKAIKACLRWSIVELAVTLFVVAVFVNSALIIISGASFYNGGGDGNDGDDNDGDDDDASGPADISADLYSLFNLFSEKISSSAGILFAVSLLFSGISCGIVGTMAGQLVMEGAWHIRVSPFFRRLITRCVAIIPAMIVAIAVGRSGLAQALVACNYILAIGLIFVSFPLLWYTCQDKYMRVPAEDGAGTISMKNGIISTVFGWAVYLLVIALDIATVVLVGLGLTSD